MVNFKFAIVGLAALGSMVLQSANVSAMPLGSLTNTVSAVTTDVQAARWVCGPFRCWWRPNYYSYYGYGWGGPRVYGRPSWGGFYGRRWSGGRFYARPW